MKKLIAKIGLIILCVTSYMLVSAQNNISDKKTEVENMKNAIIDLDKIIYEYERKIDSLQTNEKTCDKALYNYYKNKLENRYADARKCIMIIDSIYSNRPTENKQ